MSPLFALVVVLLTFAVCSSSLAVRPTASGETAPAVTVVVRPEDFGAVGDGKANDWVPIQRALVACATAVYSPTAPRSCRVLFSKTYLSGPLIVNSS
eukprot:COSAG02_NODE_28008_length_590_cov_0.901804_2_plen_96_part_01